MAICRVHGDDVPADEVSFLALRTRGLYILAL